MIDLRSDTVTLPTAAMRAAALDAVVGDDVYREDPTVIALEARAAALVGLEAGLFVASGTMGNLCALLTHGGRGQRVICGRDSHIFRYEAGGASTLGGLVFDPVANRADGGLDLAELAEALPSPDDPHVAATGVVALENSHSRCGGVAVTVETTAAIVELAHAAGVPVHLDGARLVNAAVALGVPAARLIAGADTVQLCLSKGLGAPVGSVLLGPAGFIERARRVRKLLGGGMRQAGILAAMGLVALDTMPARLHLDHARARALADALRARCGDRLEVATPETNVVLLRPRPGRPGPDALVAAVRDRGVLLSTLGADRARAVTHLGIDDAAIERAIDAIAACA